MIVSVSETVLDRYTVIMLAEDIPSGAYYVVLNGKKHKMIPVYESDLRTFAIEGRFDLAGEEITFLSNDE